MNRVIGIIEVGSTVTKGYIYKEKQLIDLPYSNIEFKKNYQLDQKIKESDKELLFDYIDNLNKKTKELYVYGTGFFRGLTEEEKDVFLKEFKTRMGVNFNILSSKEENKYTVFGALTNIDYPNNIAVMVGGGSSTEIAIVKNRKIIEELNLNIGVLDVLKVFPDLANDLATSKISDVINYIKEYLVPLQAKANILVLGGGAHKMFRDMVGYQYNNKINFSNNEQLDIIEKNIMFSRDVDYFYKISLSEMSEKTPNMPNWWDGTRAIVSFVEALSDVLEAEYIIPTNTSAVYGIIDYLKKEKTPV